MTRLFVFDKTNKQPAVLGGRIDLQQIEVSQLGSRYRCIIPVTFHGFWIRKSVWNPIGPKDLQFTTCHNRFFLGGFSLVKPWKTWWDWFVARWGRLWALLYRSRHRLSACYRGFRGEGDHHAFARSRWGRFLGGVAPWSFHHPTTLRVVNG